MTAELMTLTLALLALATATALDLYAALAALGLAASLGLVVLPPPLSGLAAIPVWATLAGILIVQLLIVRHRLGDLSWNLLHTAVRPTAAALVAGTGLSSASHGLQWTGALLGLALGLHVHLAALGIRTAARTSASGWKPGLLTALQSGLAAVLAVLAFVRPAEAAVCAALLLTLPLPWLPAFWRAGLMAARAAVEALTPRPRSRNWEVGTHAWRPVWIQQLEERSDEPRETVRSTPATLACLDGRWVFRRGRLLRAVEGTAFVHGRIRGRYTRLGGDSGRTDGAPLLETVRVSGDESYDLCVARDGLPGGVILADLGLWAEDVEHQSATGV